MSASAYLAIKQLVSARDEAREAKLRWHAAAARWGPCKKSESTGERCHESDIKREYWCTPCALKDRPHAEYRRASAKAGGALRGLLKIGRAMVARDAALEGAIDQRAASREAQHA